MESVDALEGEATAPHSLNRILAGTGGAAIAVGSAAVWYFDPAKANFFPVCPLFAITGFACPGCGLTRGFHALFHGEFLTAMQFNALIPVWAFIFGYLFLSLALFAIKGRSLPLKLPSPVVLSMFLVALLAFGIVRNLPYHPFSLLYPSGL